MITKLFIDSAFDGLHYVDTTAKHRRGADLRQASYTVNNLNQHTQRTVPGYVDIKGLALATNSVTVNSQTPYRRGEYFRKELSVGNGSASVWQGITVAAPTETSVTGNIYVPKTPEVFTHDADGNLTQDGRWNYTWDAENRLTRVESVSTTPQGSHRKVEWKHDWQGRRIRQTTFDGSSGSYVVVEDLIFLSDPASAGRHVAELNAANNALVRSYVWGLDLSGTMDGAGGVGGLLMMNSVANGTHFYAYDGNGNVAGLVKGSDGTRSAVYEYEPFGKVLRTTGAMSDENRFQFSTKRCDRTTDFNLYEYRILGDGRWLTKDPIGEASFLKLHGATLKLQAIRQQSILPSYLFVLNNAVAAVDILGLWVARPYPPKDDITTIVCQGGKAVPRLAPDTKVNSRCVNLCLKSHEQSHADDANAEGACNGKEDGVAVAASSNAERANSEIKAYQRQLKCLKKVQSLGVAEPPDKNGKYAEDCYCRLGNLNSYIDEVTKRLAEWEKANPDDPNTWPDER